MKYSCRFIKTQLSLLALRFLSKIHKKWENTKETASFKFIEIFRECFFFLKLKIDDFILLKFYKQRIFIFIHWTGQKYWIHSFVYLLFNFKFLSFISILLNWIIILECAYQKRAIFKLAPSEWSKQFPNYDIKYVRRDKIWNMKLRWMKYFSLSQTIVVCSIKF